MLKKAAVLTLPAPARRDAPLRRQGRSSVADHRFTFHASRFTILGNDARTPLAEFFSILLGSSFWAVRVRRGLGGKPFP